MKRRNVGVMLSLWVAALLGIGLLSVSAGTPSVSAQEQAVVSVMNGQPRQQDAAVWAIDQMTFDSNYPDGFTLQIKGESSGGPIVSARAEWTHRPNSRDNQPLTVRRADGEFDAQTGVFTAHWTPRDSTQVPPWVSVQYRWKLRDEAGNEYVTDTAVAEYEDLSDEWIRTESDDVLVFSTGLSEDVNEMVIEAMADQRQKYIDGWGGTLPYKPRVILFGDFASWLKWQVGYEDTTGLGLIAVGFTSDVWGGTVQVLFGSEEDLAWSTVLHEVEHLHQQEFLAGRNTFTPGWFIEGDASYYQEGDMSYAVQYVNDLVLFDDLPMMFQGNGPTIVGENALDGYYIGYMFFTWLEDNWGLEAHREIMTRLAEDAPFFETLEEVTGMSTDELEMAFRTWLGASPYAPTLVPTWTPSFPVITTPNPGG